MTSVPGTLLRIITTHWGNCYFINEERRLRDVKFVHSLTQQKCECLLCSRPCCPHKVDRGQDTETNLNRYIHKIINGNEGSKLEAKTEHWTGTDFRQEGPSDVVMLKRILEGLRVGVTLQAEEILCVKVLSQGRVGCWSETKKSHSPGEERSVDGRSAVTGPCRALRATGSGLDPMLSLWGALRSGACS